MLAQMISEKIPFFIDNKKLTTVKVDQVTYSVQLSSKRWMREILYHLLLFQFYFPYKNHKIKIIILRQIYFNLLYVYDFEWKEFVTIN